MAAKRRSHGTGPATAPEEWALRPEAAEYIGVSPKTLANWASRRYGPRFVKTGKLAHYPWSELEAWMRKRTR